MLFLFFVSLWDYSYDAVIDCAYDNNVYAYSNDYLDDFTNNVRAYRFPFETYDDMRTSTRLDLLVRNKFFGNRTTTLSTHFSTSHYLNNTKKDFQNIELGLRQSFGTYAFKVTYSITPDYLIRYYRNPQGRSTDYIGCSVKYNSLAGKLSYHEKPITAFVKYRYRWDDYIAEFDLYDAQNHIVETGIVFTPNERLELSAQYAYRNNKTDTTESLSSPEEDVPESSYDQHAPHVAASYWLKLLFPARLGIGYKYTFRRYTTIVADDVLHYGRQDHVHRFNADLALRIMTGMYVELAYVRQIRKATSEIFPEIKSIKDYDKYAMSAGLRLYH
ncbi:hypothetical protein AMJ87_06930 [candidate division WOR_3 bacterium SM23_60]|uniref:Uncharacterized protein n=1 Tax=candidate division WOR_3 bacterium SM23_60 TaxID=1703780 RepID=A0A0S8GG69_UNCW3|nr:MAG: hypothetical protein AMJ87_06930 [candidate division WOR_3 bacterium SM23_60]